MKLEGWRRIRQLTTSIFSELAARKQAAKAEGRGVIDLSTGSPRATMCARAKIPGGRSSREFAAFNSAHRQRRAQYRASHVG